MSYSVDGTSEPEKHGDTAASIEEMREHNQTGRNKGCPQFKAQPK